MPRLRPLLLPLFLAPALLAVGCGWLPDLPQAPEPAPRAAAECDDQSLALGWSDKAYEELSDCPDATRRGFRK